MNYMTDERPADLDIEMVCRTDYCRRFERAARYSFARALNVQREQGVDGIVHIQIPHVVEKPKMLIF